MAVAALSTKNPYYTQRELDWTMMRDAYGGERYIKDKAEQYLPPTRQMVFEGMAYGQAGWTAYQAYRTRAVYHELVKPAVMAMLGVMHRKAPDIALPAKMDKMRTSATFGGESLDWLIQKVNEQQMLMGRYGLFLDVATGALADAMPYIIGYDAETMVNWDSTQLGDDKGQRAINLVVLNESTYERRAGLQWTQIMRYRVLALAGAVRDAWPDIAANDGEYVAAEVRHSQNIADSEFLKPSLAGRVLDQVPFVFVGPRDLVPEPDIPVLMPLARIGLAAYRTEADYRQSLYMQGQDTLVITGQQSQTDTKTTLGAFGSIDLPIGGTAEFIGAQSNGIKDQETAIQNDLKRAAQLGAQLLSERGNEAEAGAALAIRVASRTATLTTVAKTGAAGLQQILRLAAKWVGADPEQVIVTPNLDFADDPAQAQDLVYLQTAKNLGLQLSARSVHGWLEKREFTKLTFEEEQAEIDKEPKPLVPVSAGMRGAPGGGGDFGGGPGGMKGPVAKAAKKPAAKGGAK